MHYVIVDFVVRQNSGGILSILQDVNKFALEHTEDRFTFIVGTDGLITTSPNIKVILRPDLQRNYIKRIFFDFWRGAGVINSLKPDVVISLQNTAVLGVNAPEMLYVHQPLPFETNYKFSFFKSSERKMAFYQSLVGSVIKLNLRSFHKGAITVQTHWMLEEVQKYAKTPIFVTRPSIDKNDFKGQILGSKGSNFFFPSTAMVYKNHRNLVDAYEMLSDDVRREHHLIFTISRKEYGRLYGQVPDDSNIKFLGRIPRAKVIEILNHSILVFPSKIETLGLPLIEAMILQRQIVAANISPVTEVTSEYDSISYFDPDDVKSIYNSLLAGIRMNPSRRSFKETNDNGWQAFFSNVEALNHAK